MMKFGGSLARNIDFEVANFKLLVKTRRKTLILVLQLVKIEGSLARNARFGASTCVIASLAAPCLWGKLQNLMFEKVSKCQNWRNLARNACFEACTCVVLSSWLGPGSAVSMGEAAETFLLQGF